MNAIEKYPRVGSGMAVLGDLGGRCDLPLQATLLIYVQLWDSLSIATKRATIIVGLEIHSTINLVYYIVQGVPKGTVTFQSFRIKKLENLRKFFSHL